MIIEGKVGLSTGGDSADEEIRLSRQREQVVLDGGGRLYEAVRTGQIYTVATTGAGAAPGTAVSTTAALGLWNPPNSGKNLVILQALWDWGGGTLGVGRLWYVMHAYSAAVPGGTELVPANNLNLVGGVARAFMTATGLGTGTAMRPGFIIGSALAAEQALNKAIDKEFLEGEFVVPPGGAFSLQEIGAAGTSPTVIQAFTYQEVSV